MTFCELSSTCVVEEADSPLSRSSLGIVRKALVVTQVRLETTQAWPAISLRWLMSLA